jgi:starch phosphorylase
MKAAFNGIPQVGTIDGWWEEGYDGTNGWAIPYPPAGATPEEVDAWDVDHFYRLVEEELIPLYYERDLDGVPHGWADRMRNAIRVAFSRFNARQMVQQYVERYYVPALRREPFGDDPPAV